MTTLEMIQAEIAAIPQENLDELHDIVRAFTTSRKRAHGPSIMAELRNIRIEGPPDFAENLDLYLTGGKSIDEDVH